MLDEPATLLAIFIILVSLIACGGDDSPNESANGGPPEPAAPAMENGPNADATVAKAGERQAAATRNSSAASGTRQPTAPTMSATKPPAETSVQGTVPGTTVERDVKTTKPSTSGRDAASVSPQFTDQVLFQDIYAGMDLGQFALDSEAEIPMPERKKGHLMTLRNLRSPDKHPPGKFPYSEVRDHPYLHLFPGLHHAVEQAGGNPPGTDFSSTNHMAMPVWKPTSSCLGTG